MRVKGTGVCVVCGAEFEMTRPHKTHCSRRCTMIERNRKARAKAKAKAKLVGVYCLYNEDIICYERKCDSCGWNPVVAQRRKEAMGNG